MIPERLYNRVRFAIENLVMRGTGFRLLLVSLLVAFVSLAFGLLAYWQVPGFADAGDSTWWAFLRLTDPGYLGDDEGALRRVLSTVLTILGYVLFLGALIAIMTQWLHERIQLYERGLTPIVQQGHVVILGWSSRTGDIVRGLVTSTGRLRRFLARHGANRLRIVILDEDIGSHRLAELRGELGEDWEPGRVWLRSGSPLRLEDLERVDFTHASAILIPAEGRRFVGPDIADANAFKTILTLHQTLAAIPPASRPFIAGEFQDPRRMAIARAMFDGPIELLASANGVATLIARCIEQPGIFQVYDHMLGVRGGARIYVRECRTLEGTSFGKIQDAFDKAIPTGVLRRNGELRLNPQGSERSEPLGAKDQLIILASAFEHTAPRAGFKPGTERGASPALPVNTETNERRVLLVGWGAAVPALLDDLAQIPAQRFAVTSLSTVDRGARRRQIEEMREQPMDQDLELVEGDYTEPGVLLALDPTRFDSVVFMGRDWAGAGVDDEVDARVILGVVLLNDALGACDARPRILVELRERENRPLLEGLADEFILSQQLTSHLLAQVALKPELATVFRGLLGAFGAGIALRPPETKAAQPRVSFDALSKEVAARGEILIGIRVRMADQSTGKLHLNPGRDSQWPAKEIDGLAVIA